MPDTISQLPSDEEIAAELADTEMMFGETWQHCQRCEPCHRRWLFALGLGRLVR